MSFWKRLWRREAGAAPVVQSPATSPTPAAPAPAPPAGFAGLPATEQALAWREALEAAKGTLEGADCLPVAGGGMLTGSFGSMGRRVDLTRVADGISSMQMQMAGARPTLILELGAEPTALFPTHERIRLSGDLHHVMHPADLERTSAARNLLPAALFDDWARALVEHDAIRVVVMLESVMVHFHEEVDPRALDLATTLPSLLALADRYATELEDLPALLPESLVRCDHCSERYDPLRGLECPGCGAPTTPLKRPRDASAGPDMTFDDDGPADSVEAEMAALARQWPAPLTLFRYSDHVGVSGKHEGRPFTARARGDRASSRLSLRLDVAIGSLQISRDARGMEGERLTDRLDAATLELLRRCLAETGACALRAEDTYVQLVWEPAQSATTPTWLAPRLSTLNACCSALEELPGEVVRSARHCLYCDALVEDELGTCSHCGAELDDAR